MHSAGILLHRAGPTGPLILLGHMGGPFWARKDAGAWSIPKGEHGADDDPLAAAVREFTEELGSPPPPGSPVPLGTVRQPSGKGSPSSRSRVTSTPTRSSATPSTLEWPRGSGRMQEFPEIDRAAWFGLDDGRRAVVRGQLAFLDRLEALLAGSHREPDTAG